MATTKKKQGNPILRDMRRVGLTKEEIDNTIKVMTSLRDKTALMFDHSKEEEPLYDDICGEACNVLNCLYQLKEQYA